MKLVAVVAGFALGMGASAACAQDNATQWDFESGNLTRSYGPGQLLFWDDSEGIPGSAEAATAFGTTSSFGISPIGGVDARVMQIPAYFGTQGLLCLHASPANGGGSYVNRFTMAFDIYVDSFTYFNGSGWLPLYNSSADNRNDADTYIQFGQGVGISGEYGGKLNPDTWNRVFLTYNLDDDGVPRLTKYINGSFVGWNILDEGVDGRWSLYAVNDPDQDVADQFFLFTEPEGLYTSQAYINSIYFVDAVIDGKTIEQIGGPDADGIIPAPEPTCACDFDGSGAVNSADFFAFLTAFFTEAPPADFNNDSVINSADFFDFLTCFFTLPDGCQ